MAAKLKVQPLKNVVLSPTADAKNYELLVVVEPGMDVGMKIGRPLPLTKKGKLRRKRILAVLEKELEGKKRKVELLVVFGEWDETESLFGPIVRSSVAAWVAISGPVYVQYALPALLWTVHGLTCKLDRVPSVAVVGSVLGDNVMLVANEIAKTYSKSVITVLTRLCLSASDYVVSGFDRKLRLVLTKAAPLPTD